MTVFILHAETFDMVTDADIAVVDFWAEWCAPCKQFAKVFEKVSFQFPKVLFGSVNIEEEPLIAETFHVRSIPHLMIVKQGVAIYSESGSVPESTLRELIEQAKETDVSHLKEQSGKSE